MRDFKRMQTDPPAGVSASPIADNVMTWYDIFHLILSPSDRMMENTSGTLSVFRNHG